MPHRNVRYANPCSPDGHLRPSTHRDRQRVDWFFLYLGTPGWEETSL